LLILKANSEESLMNMGVLDRTPVLNCSAIPQYAVYTHSTTSIYSGILVLLLSTPFMDAIYRVKVPNAAGSGNRKVNARVSNAMQNLKEAVYISY